MAAQEGDSDDWESANHQLQALSIKQEQQEEQEEDEEEEGRKPIAIDAAVIEALQKGREQDRKTITEIENMVIKFIGDTSRDILEFPVQYGTYQKMLAHRVAQAYALQTSTVDYEDGHGRVIGSRTKDTRLRKVRLTKMDLSAPEFQLQGLQSGPGGPKILFRRPGGPDQGRGPLGAGGADFLKASNSSQSFKDKEDDYYRARERLGIGGGGGPPQMGGMPAQHAAGASGPGASQPYPGPGRGGYGGGRGPPAGMPYVGPMGVPGVGVVPMGGMPAMGMPMGGRGPPGVDPGGRGRGRKAVFRDRDRELQDPDYVRGFNRDGQPNAYEQQGYEMEGYQEYAAPLQQWGSGQYRMPPPPPPPLPAQSPYQPGGQQGMKGVGGGPGGPGVGVSGAGVSPGGMGAMYPGSAPGGMPVPVVGAGPTAQMGGMARAGSYPAAIPMSPYAMQGYPGPMGYPGMPGQGAMAYSGMAAAYGPYGAQMAAAGYGYMEPGGASPGDAAAGMAAAAAQGAYGPMYAGGVGYAMYPQQHPMAAAMQGAGGVRGPGMHGGVLPGMAAAMPVSGVAPGMEHVAAMYGGAGHYAGGQYGQYGQYGMSPEGQHKPPTPQQVQQHMQQQQQQQQQQMGRMQLPQHGGSGGGSGPHSGSLSGGAAAGPQTPEPGASGGAPIARHDSGSAN